MNKIFGFLANLVISSFHLLNSVKSKKKEEVIWKIENLDISEFEKISYQQDNYKGHFTITNSTIIAYDTDGKCCLAPLNFLALLSLWTANFKYNNNTPVPPKKVKKFNDQHIWSFQKAYDFIQSHNMKYYCLSLL